MNKTPIGWAKNPDGTQGYSWNPITGCLNGCEYCYARRLANTRLKERYLANRQVSLDKGINLLCFDLRFATPFYPRFWQEKLFQPYVKGRAKGIFVCDMSDLFGIGVPEEWTKMVMNTIKECPQHRFYLLTKQPQNLIKWSPFPDNCWVGVSATNWLMFSDALGELTHIKAKVKYISFEPLLEQIRLDELQKLLFQKGNLDWVIIGAQTKPTIMPKIEWVKEIVEACDNANIPVFLKNNLNSENLPGNAFDEAGLVRREMPK